MGFSRQEYWSGMPLPSLKRNVSRCHCFFLSLSSHLLLSSLRRGIYKGPSKGLYTGGKCNQIITQLTAELLELDTPKERHMLRTYKKKL